MTDVVLVTGATGFIGRHLVRHLAVQGRRVIAAGRGAERQPWPDGVVARELPDLGAGVDWSPLLVGASYVVHLAGVAHTSGIADELYDTVNRRAATTLARAARAAGAKRFVLMSSVRAQTGPAAVAVLTEADTPRPTDAYGRSKLDAERAVATSLEGSNTGWVVLRPVLVYGPGVKGNMATLLRLARLPLPLPLGALAGRRSLVAIDNLATAVAHALVEPRCIGGTFLVADAEPPVTVPEIIAALRSGLGRAPSLFPVPAALLAGAARLAGFGQVWERLADDLVVDTSRLRATGWVASSATREALAATARETTD